MNLHASLSICYESEFFSLPQLRFQFGGEWISSPQKERKRAKGGAKERDKRKSASLGFRSMGFFRGLSTIRLDKLTGQSEWGRRNYFKWRWIVNLGEVVESR